MIEKLKLDKKSLWYLGATLAIAIVIGIALIYHFSKPAIKETPTEEKPAEKSMEEIIKDLTPPQGEPEPLSEEIVKDLTSPEKGEKPVPLPEEIIKDLTVPK